MKRSLNIPLVETIKERCRVCYTCVRECPAKAIRIAVGQAEVVPERCIGCGNCVRVCSQHAKKVMDSIDEVKFLLSGAAKVAACIAPSFPAEFTTFDAETLVGMVRALGFAYVNEVAFGADLVAKRYERLMARPDTRQMIATTCPAVVAYVERYHPDMVPRLAPIVSPMVALARALRRIHGQDLKVVFIGPCIAKKGEALSQNLPQDINAVLTFIELEKMLEEKDIGPRSAGRSDFDPPHAGAGALFSVSRGLLQAAGIHEDLISSNVVAADGRTNFVEALQELQEGTLDAKLLEVLACNGCVTGPGLNCQSPLFKRKGLVSDYVRQRLAQRDPKVLAEEVGRFDDLDLSRVFTSDDQRVAVPFEDEIRQIMARMGKVAPGDELNCGACGYDTCHEHAVAIFKGLAEPEMCLPHNIEQLRKMVKELAVSNDQLASTQQALMQSEKLASMGQLAAGIAHEVNNPLGVVLMYAHMLLEEAGKNSPVRADLAMIAEQADRCKKIVAGLLHFARQNKVVLEPTNLCGLVDRAMRSLPAPEGVTIRVRHEMDDPVAEIDADQIVQVLNNLVSNAYAAMAGGGELTIRTTGDSERVQLLVSDTGVGIAPENLGKIFEPFFTTKQIGKGTGLGLAVTYGIVKMHCGDIQVASNANPAAGATGATFTVTLPRQRKQD